MKRVKSLLALVVALLMVFAIVGCGKDDPTGEGDGGGEITPPESTTTYVDVGHAPSAPEVSQAALSGYTTYYFDSQSGDDANSGTTESAPLKSKAKAEQIIGAVEESVPTRILFKAGSTYDEGTFRITGAKAAAATPLLIGTYGYTDEAERFASFTAARASSNVYVPVIEVNSVSNVQVRNLEVYGPLADYGILLQAETPGAMENVVIDNNYIHDVNFCYKKEDVNAMVQILGGTQVSEDLTLPSLDSMDYPNATLTQQICPNNRFGTHIFGGIAVRAEGTRPTWYEGLWLTDNRIEYVARSGIFMQSKWSSKPGITVGGAANPYYDDEHGWYPYKNANIVGNALSVIGGDGIVMTTVVNGYVEGNTCYHAQYLCRNGYYNAGIWLLGCKNVIMQFNEAAYTRGASNQDSTGFDIDVACVDCTMQYNYSHHNGGGSLLWCGGAEEQKQYDIDGNPILDRFGDPVSVLTVNEWGNNVVRNNVFADEYGPILIVNKHSPNAYFENNTVILAAQNPGIGTYKIVQNNLPGDTRLDAAEYFISENWQFTNNIFYMKGNYAVDFSLDTTKSAYLTSNVFYGFSDAFVYDIQNPLSSRIVSTDNRTFNPGDSLKATVANGFASAKGFVPSNAQTFSGAYALTTMNKYDFAGRQVTQGVYYFGAFAQ